MEDNKKHETNQKAPDGSMRGAGSWLLAVVSIAVFLRLFRLGWRDYWHDEVHNLIKTTQIGRVVFEGDMVSNHPPLFALLLTAWRGLGVPDTEWWMRLLPAILGVLGVAAAYRLGREFYGARAGLLGAFLVALAPLHVFHSQDLKTYILLPFTATIAVYMLYRAVESNGIGRWALYSLWAAIACYSDLFAAPLLVSINLWFLIQVRSRPGRLRNWIVANVIGALLFLPQLGIMLGKFNTVIRQPEHWWVPEATLSSLAFYLKAIAFGYSDLDPFFKIAMLIFCVFGGAGVYFGYRRNGRATSLLLLWSAVSVSIVFGLSLVLSQSIFLIRAMLAYAIPVYLLAGVGIARLPGALFRGAAITVFAGLAAMPLVEHYVGSYPDLEFPHRPGIHAPVEHKLLTEHILQNWKEGDVVLTTGNASWLPLYWYGLKDRPLHFATVGTEFIDFFHANNPRTTSREDFDHYFPKDVRRLVDGKDRVWLVFTEWERVYLDGNPMRVWRWMDSHYTQIDHAAFKNVELFLFAKTENGEAIRTLRRDEDDGATAHMTFSADRVWTHTRQAPDIGITETPPLDRPGDLRLRFTDDASDPVQLLAETTRTRRVSFTIENRKTEAVACRVHVVPSDYLIDLASLEDRDPENNVWSVDGMYAPQLDDEFYRLPVAAAHHHEPGTFSIESAMRIAGGEYSGLVYVLGSPGNGVARRSRFDLSANGTTMTSLVPRANDAIRGWNWFPTPRLHIGEDQSELSLRASVEGLEDGDESWAGLAYLSLKRCRGFARIPEGPTLVPAWPGDVELPASSTSTWSVDVDDDIGRVDVWVYELNRDGRAYRIYTNFDSLE